VIVLGISPGVRSLAYCVLLLRPDAEFPELLDSDLLKGGKPKRGADEAELKKRSKPHWLTLDVVLRRAFDDNDGRPVVMAIGPGPEKEPRVHQFVVRALLTGLCVELESHGVRIVCLNWSSARELDEILGVDVKTAVRRELSRSGRSVIRAPYVLAAGTALAAAKKASDFQLLGR